MFLFLDNSISSSESYYAHKHSGHTTTTAANAETYREMKKIVRWSTDYRYHTHRESKTDEMKESNWKKCMQWKGHFTVGPGPSRIEPEAVKIVNYFQIKNLILGLVLIWKRGWTMRV